MENIWEKRHKSIQAHSAHRFLFFTLNAENYKKQLYILNEKAFSETLSYVTIQMYVHNSHPITDIVYIKSKAHIFFFSPEEHFNFVAGYNV